MLGCDAMKTLIEIRLRLFGAETGTARLWIDDSPEDLDVGTLLPLNMADGAEWRAAIQVARSTGAVLFLLKLRAAIGSTWEVRASAGGIELFALTAAMTASKEQVAGRLVVP